MSIGEEVSPCGPRFGPRGVSAPPPQARLKPGRGLKAAPLWCCLLLAPALLLGQEVTGTIGGRVRDATAAAIADAEVTVLHAETGAARKGLTKADGAYLFPALPIGAYQIAVTRAGFKKALRSGIELHVGDHLVLDLGLEIGDLAQEVSVVADAPQVQVEGGGQSGLISGDQVRELQLNGRSFMTLIELLPGVSSDMPDRVDPNTNPLLYINGARNSAANFNIDGGSNADTIVGSGSLNTFTSVESIAEFRVATSSFTAEYGRGGFAQVNVVTRGGTQNFRGALFYFTRHDAVDARDYFSHQVLPLKLHDFGYTLGGPLLLPGGYNRSRSKTFFFWTHHFMRLSTRGEAVNTTVPALAERSGDFSGRGPGRDGLFGTADDPVIDPDTGAGFPEGVIPPSRIDPHARKLLNLYPVPNFRGPGSINFTSAAASQQRWREELIRIDHNFSPSWKLFGRFVQDSAFIRNPYGGSLTTSIGTRFPGISATRATRPGKNLTVTMTNLFSSTSLNELRFTYAGREITQHPINDQAERARLGISIPEIFPENDGNVIPTITLGSGFAALNVSRVWLKQYYDLEVSNNFTKLVGRHALKAGALFSRGGNRENPTGPNTNGNFTFNTGLAGNPIANLLLGLPFQYAEAERFVVSNARFAMFEAYLQDEFRVTPRLHLGLGLRYSVYGNPYDRDNVLTNFLPAQFDAARAPGIDSLGRRLPGTGDALNGLIIAGRNSPYGRRVTESSADLFGPRFNFAYDLFGRRKTAIRGGYGVYYTRPLIGTFINSAFDNPPFSRSVTIETPSFHNPGGGREALETAPNLTALGTPMLAPTIQQWSFGVQQELFRRAILEVAYVGSHGTHLFRPLNINSPTPGIGGAAGGPPYNAIRPYRGWATITQRQSTALSTYHSLQVKFDRRLAGGLSLGGVYTFSKSIDTASSDRGGSDVPPDSRNARAERGPSDFDRSHIFTVNSIWFLPRFTRRPGAASALLNGWQISGIGRMWTGRPFDVTMSQDVARIGATQNQRPDLVADPRGPRAVEEWFNRGAFARPATGAFGNMGRNRLRGPGVNKWDLSMFKNFRWGEGRNMQFRTEFYNAFNHPSFTTVGASLTTTNAGVNPAANNFAVITATRDARVLQFGLRITF